MQRLSRMRDRGTDLTRLDPQTPVLIGVGEASEVIDAANYRARSAVELAAAAALAAVEDAGLDPSVVAGQLGTVAGVRQFEVSTPNATAPLGRSTNFPRSVAARLGAVPARAVLEVAGGQGPQRLVNEFAGRIAAGEENLVLLVGAEAISTVRHFAGTAERPDFSETVEGSLEDRGLGLDGLTTTEESLYGLVGAPPRYALLENARRARLGSAAADYRMVMGELLAPFTQVAAAHPHAAVRVGRTADDLATPSARNRIVVDPYPRMMIARDQVNQGAAVLLTSARHARVLGVPPERWVFLHGHADLVERPILERPDLDKSPAAVTSVAHALDLAGTTIAELATIDLYSCFPIAVFAVTDAFGLSTADPRRLTVTGGLPFFGGPGNNYSMHAIAETVRQVRQMPGAFGLVGANGGFLSKYSVGIYSATPRAWRASDSARVHLSLPASRAVPRVGRADGNATVETYTVWNGRDGDKRAVVIGRMQASGARFIARGGDDDSAFTDYLQAPGPVDKPIVVKSTDDGNVAGPGLQGLQ
ncbi:acetyl-CoA acetyltransferase [Nocardia rhamnosiphila]|uniref:Acetyl-CoA acetyltransferase n=1 Tax=Nocardia rhamnosiphila TaxID=426716 RepID=A0ABV2WRE4_9NOCA